MLAVQAEGAEVETVEGLADERRAAPDPAGVPRAARAAVRLLHAGDAARRRRRCSTRTRPERGGDPRVPRRQRLPLHRLRRHRRGGAPGGAGARGRTRDDGAATSARACCASRIPGSCAGRALPRRHPAARDAARAPSCAARTPTRGSPDRQPRGAGARRASSRVLTGEDLARPSAPFATALDARRGRRRRTRRMLADRQACASSASRRGRRRALARTSPRTRVELDRRRVGAAAGRSSTRRRRSSRARRSCTTTWRQQLRAHRVRARRRRRAFARPTHVFRKRFHHGRCHGGAARGRAASSPTGTPATRRLTVWTSTQIPHLRPHVSPAPLGIAESQLRVIAPAVGGGFGLKAHALRRGGDRPRAVAARSAAPVKWIEDRYEHLAASGHAKEIVCELEIAIEGRRTLPRASAGHYIGDGGAYPAYPWTCADRPALRGRDRCRASTTIQARPLPRSTRRSRTSARRRPTAASAGRRGSTAREVLDRRRRARARHRPVELRLQNTIPDEPPYAPRPGCKYDGGSYAESHAQGDGADRLRGAPRAPGASCAQQGRYLGIGFSPFVEPGAWAGEIAERQRLPGRVPRLGQRDDGARRLGHRHDRPAHHGQAHETTIAQVAADKLGVPIEDVQGRPGRHGRRGRTATGHATAAARP